MARTGEREPFQWRGEWQAPSPGTHSYPPRRSRFDPPLRTCPHCGLGAYTDDPTCPVCTARYRERWWTRLGARLRRR